MSKVMTFNGSVAANSTNTSIFAGQLHEFCAGPSRIRLFMSASAVGLKTSVLVGNETFAQDQEILRLNNTLGPGANEDYFVEAAGLAGERIVVSLRNTTVGAITGLVRAEIFPA